MQDLTITCVQTNLKWQDKVYNLAHIESLLEDHLADSDVIILPEMFSTGFSMEAELLAESMSGPTVEWMKAQNLKYDRVVCGSLIIEDEGKFYNRFIWVDGDKTATYNKRHLFSLLGEDDHYTPGQQHTIIDFKGWRIQPFICYDLRFPAWCRSVDDADLQIYVANWPERRIANWITLLEARAIENQCYVAGINRVGNDNNDIHHTGDSGIYDPFGKTLDSFTGSDAVFTRTLSAEHLKKCRQKFPFLNDRDNFTFLNKH